LLLAEEVMDILLNMKGKLTHEERRHPDDLRRETLIGGTSFKRSRTFL